MTVGNHAAVVHVATVEFSETSAEHMIVAARGQGLEGRSCKAQAQYLRTGEA